ncbi:MAG: 50S ribosomal protein L4 [Candidatus Brocadiae bacterium]|nr:50S ribosomal protein L4 [Candidatus Brocadiia bacterium]
MDIPVYSMAGQVVDHVAVDESALGGKPNMELVRQAIIMYEANKRVGTAKTKKRDEISASGRKVWRQKHTGRARHSTRASPLWVGGGVAHGPRPRDFRQKMNKAARRKALYSAFLAKAIDGEVMVLDRLELPELRTREMVAVLRNLGVDRTFLIVPDRHDPDLWRCTRNIQGAAMRTSRELNAYEMIRPSRVIFTLEAIRQFLAGAAQVERPAREEVEVGEDG